LILKGLSIKHLVINAGAMRTPHWHPINAEIGYVQSGSARMTVMAG
jgi:oxalate decarboxylase